MGIVFGQIIPCRTCKGDGKRHRKMTDAEQSERNRELRRAKARGEEPPPLDTRCEDCNGEGYVTP